ncbi:ATP-binding protein [Curtobacterium sp. VKM Ac-1376]|uniref:ATP-binding protein n=1 Tax=Curtobacterium sp. VKM Ac-1376 TaxID=123312 RepID=UPI00188B9B38|nr:ATP-binding protein [Curtobacterium sp. VKM Ac-1376]MBF4615468.1 ATP-binding protein [Curtobacterium sp. VKM Ac-1376]
MRTINFKVDAKLLRELGERLVGRPHIALAELIKNSYDADARNVEIAFTGDRITIADDGHGMTTEDFERRWMRIGTTEKDQRGTSPKLGRALTGSKGVGRLSAQLLASTLQFNSTADTAGAKEIHAEIDWPRELRRENLTDVRVEFEETTPITQFAAESGHGTSIVLGGLLATWDEEHFADLAREIWALQPPFAVSEDDSSAFSVTLSTPFPSIQERFDDQMVKIMDAARATITGRLLDADEEPPDNADRFVLPARNVEIDEEGEIPHEAEAEPEAMGLASTRQALIDVRLEAGISSRYVVDIPDCRIDAFDFEIRVFNLQYRQPGRISVGDARNYFNRFGGVHIYDNGFRLPYYGSETDWLRLELDHARRLSRSQLLPEELHVSNAMQDLPSNKRVFGAVNISTSIEGRAAELAALPRTQALSIQITRDRLSDNLAFEQLRRAVRVGIDAYALAQSQTKAVRSLQAGRGRTANPDVLVRQLDETVEALREELPTTAYETLHDVADNLAKEVKAQQSETRAYASLLGSLATAGMTSLAYEHEVSHQIGEIEAIRRKLRRIGEDAPKGTGEQIVGVLSRLDAWATRSERIRRLFASLLDEEDRTRISRLNARGVIEDAADALRVMARATEIDSSDIPADLRLPLGTFTGWTSVFQNIFVNAFRATLERTPALVRVDGGRNGGKAWVRVQDNGVGGVDLTHAARLFRPFERQGEVSPRAKILGLGGSGLGLTIVKMITDAAQSNIGFVEPDPGWSTALRIDWNDS